MVLLAKPRHFLLVLLAWPSAPLPTVTAQDSFAVVQIYNATDDRSIPYQIQWGNARQVYTVKPHDRLYHYDRQEFANQNTSPPQIEFLSNVNGAKKAYRLRPSASSKSNSGGNIYVFEKVTDDKDEAPIELVQLGVFVEYNNKLVARLLAQKQYAKAIERCDRVLDVAPGDAPSSNSRGRANYLLKNFDQAIDDFTRAIGLDPNQAMYHSNRGYSHIAVDQNDKALADFEVAILFNPELSNARWGRELAKIQRERARTTQPGPRVARRLSAPVLEETRLDTSTTEKATYSLPKEFEPYITGEAFEALERFRLGSKVDADENRRLQVAYDRAFEEGRFIDAQEANYIRAIEREPVAALWKILNSPDGNSYYLPKFTPVEERLDGLKRPLVGKESDKLIYVKSDDDLAGLRIAIRRPPQEPGDGGLETAAIIPFRWVKGSGVVPLDPPDNLRVLIQLKKEGDHAMLGMSFSLTTAADGTWDLRPEIYTSPKFGEDRFKAASSTVVSPRGCMDCHALGFNIKASKFVGPARGGEVDFIAAMKEMPGFRGFLDDARKQGASAPDLEQAESIVVRPDVQILTRRSLRIAVAKLWNAIYYAKQPYLDDADGRFVEYHDRYGSAWLEAGDLDKALEHLNKAVGRGPEVAALYLKRGWIFERQQRLDDAIRDLDQAIRLDPKHAFAYVTRSAVHAKAGRYNLARRDADLAIRLGPKMASAVFARAELEALAGNYQQALADTDSAVRLQPQFAAAHNLRARLLATTPVAEVRNGTEAVRAATLACELSGWKTPEFLDTLAAAYAESANFTEAVRWQETAVAERGLAQAVKEDATRTARDRLELYRKNLPFRDTPRAPPALPAG